MSIPTAYVEVTLERIHGLASVMGTTSCVFAIASVGRRVFGRSRQIPRSASQHDLHGEPMPWNEVVQVAGREAIPVTVELYDDHDRGPATPLTRIHGEVPYPYAPANQRLGSGVEIEFSVAPRFVDGGPGASVPRRAPDASGSSRVRVPAAAGPLAAVELTEVRGLYRPGTGDVAQRSAAEAGYRSQDHQGRVFTNTTVSGTYQRDHQQVELHAEVHLRRGQLPNGTHVRWRLLDVDDPFDADPRVARQWLHLLDPNDYDRHGLPQGSHGGDNRRAPRPRPPWAAVTGFATINPTATEVETNLVGSRSAVALHCPGAAGDNFMVVADLVEANGRVVPCFEGRTGVITMWHRVFVEYVRMRSAFPLPIDGIAALYEPAFIEVDVAPERMLRGDDRETLAEDREGFEHEVPRFIDRHFSHARAHEPGWFFLAAARRSFGGAAAPVLYPRGPATLVNSGPNQYVDIPIQYPRHRESHAVKLHWNDGGLAREAGFIVRSAFHSGSGTRLLLYGNDFTPEFTAGNGSEAHATAHTFHIHAQGRLEPPRIVPPGYGAPASLQAEVVGRSGETTGKSPTIDVGGRAYFGGRTVIFTQHGTFAERRGGRLRLRHDARDRLLWTIAHELCHAFGMPHRCGLFDVFSRASQRTGNNACMMNYVWHPLLDDSRREVLLGTDDRVGLAFCGKHLLELRRAQLQNNEGLRSVGW